MYMASRTVANVVTFSLVLYTVGNAAPTRLRGSTRDDNLDDNLPVSSFGNEGGYDGDYDYYDTTDNSTVEDIRNGQAFVLGEQRLSKSLEYSVESPHQPSGQDDDGSDDDSYDPVDNSTSEEIQSGPSFALRAERLVEYSSDAESEGPEENEDDLGGDYYYNSTVEGIETSHSFALDAEPPEEREDGADGDYYYGTMDNSTVEEFQSGHVFASGGKTPYASFGYSSEAPSEAADENADDSDFEYYDPIDNSTTQGVPSGPSPSLGAWVRWGCWPVCRR